MPRSPPKLLLLYLCFICVNLWLHFSVGAMHWAA